MEKFDDGFGDLSGFKILSFEEVSKGFKGDIHPFRQALEIQDAETTGIKNDEYINLTGLLGDIKVSYSGGRGEYMQYVPEKYFNDTAQNYIMDGRKHISLSAKLHLKKGTVKFSQRMGVYKPLMEVFFDEDGRLTYSLTFRYEDTGRDAIELNTHTFEEYKNLLLYMGYGNVETDYDASSFFIREFTYFLKGSATADDLYKVYGDLPASFIMKLHIPTDVVVNHLRILAKEDDTGWFSWTKDTTPLLIKVTGMFRKFQEATDYFWKNPKLLTEIYDNLDGHSEVLGKLTSNRILFASVLNAFAQRDVRSKNKTTKNALLHGNGYFIDSNILELNDTLNTIKGILSFDWDFDYKDAVFLQQKRTVTKTVEQRETDEFGKGGSTTEQTRTSTENVDPGYLYHPMHLVHFIDKGQEEANLVTALFIKAIADEEEWAEVMQNIRVGGDILAIIAGFVTMGLTGNLSVLAIADLGMAGMDLALMDDDVKTWVADLPGGKWFVENWDTIYALVGAGILSVVMMEGILTHGPALLDKIKNLKNIKGNYLTFTRQLEKLVEELQTYRLRNPGNVIEEVVLAGEKNGLLKKLLKPFLGKDANVEYILEQLDKRQISVKKAGDDLYEIYYKGQFITTRDAGEAGAFLKNNFWKTEIQLEEVVVGGTNKKLFSLWKINLKERRYNCANCAIAVDATLDGRPASALPYTVQRRFRNGKWENYASFEEGTAPIVLEAEFKAKFSEWTTDLNSLVKDLKPGKRGIVAGIKNGKNEGHVFNVVNEKGVIKYLDGQTGNRAKLVYDYYKFLSTN
ncbi:toxin glutamine deamidase domain-containing protein [uncultured Chryseobacterium sp.]|uniref:toxin glutamine deamidase domain-containing protein n=1 Tax=uncultured Chryseobacterium sp. TaxID=259322 RepID=UPI0025E33914|nr:toxin glutamine deamidase domain-containing protein [uncultured Chryseobacterium sp.]